MNENQEIKPTSKSHLKALVKKGREKAQKEAEADERDRAERAVRRRNRQGSNYDPSEDDLEDSYNPEGEPLEELKKSTLQSYVWKRSGQVRSDLSTGQHSPATNKKARGVSKAQRRLTAKNADEIGAMPNYPEVKKIASKVQDSYEPEGESIDELKSSTLRSYSQKAQQDMSNIARDSQSTGPLTGKTLKKFVKRQKGYSEDQK